MVWNQPWDMSSREAGGYRRYVRHLQMFSFFLFTAVVMGCERGFQRLAARKGSIINV